MTTPTRLYFARHGATALTAEDRFSGAIGVELSDEGREQARRLGLRLEREGITAVYTSPLSRTVETARLACAGMPIEPVSRDGLREIAHGHWEGLARAEVERRFPEEYSAWEEDPFTFAPPGGESGVGVLARALPVIREIVTAHTGERVLVVSHKATIRLVLGSLLGIDGRGYRDRLDLAPASLSVMDFRDAVRARLMLFNDTSHYTDLVHEPGRHLSSWWDPTKSDRGTGGSTS